MSVFPTAMSHSRSRPIVGLDLLRWLAALIVVVHHLGMRICERNAAEDAHLRPFVWFGWIGVQIFFVISGFVIPYSAQKATLRSFAVSRSIRLLPAAWICSTITALDLMLTRTTPEFTSNLPNAGLRSVTLYPLGPWVDGVYWTLAIELVFYLVIAALLALNRFRWVGPVMGSIGFLSSTSWILVVLHRLHLVNQKWLMVIVAKATHSRTGMFLLMQHGCYFALGTLFWLGLFDRSTKRQTLLVIYCLVGASCDIVIHAMADLGGMGSGSRTPFTPLAFWLVSMLALVLATRYNTQVHDLLGPRGSARVRVLGLMTYPLYLLHQQNGYIWLSLLRGTFPDLVCLGAVLLAAILLSYIVMRFAEQPLQRWLKQLLFARHASAAAPSQSIAATLP